MKGARDQGIKEEGMEGWRGEEWRGETLARWRELCVLSVSRESGRCAQLCDGARRIAALFPLCCLRRVFVAVSLLDFLPLCHHKQHGTRSVLLIV